MKAMLMAVLLFSALAFAQSTPPQTPPPGAKAQTGAGSATAPHRHMQGMQGMQGQDMKAMVDNFNTQLDKMKADAAKVTDPAAQDIIQDNIQMWQTLIDHMKAMQEHMSMGMMGNMQGKAGAAHKHGSATTATPPPPKSPKQ